MKIPKANSGRPKKYDFTPLKTYGDCVVIQNDKPDSVRLCAYTYAKNNGFKVATRDTENGIAVYHAGKTAQQKGD